MILHRDQAGEEENSTYSNNGKLIVAKNRFGVTGIVQLDLMVITHNLTKKQKIMTDFRIYEKGRYFYVSYDICDPLNDAIFTLQKKRRKKEQGVF